MAFFYKMFPVNIYEKEVPENFAIPSMYFPVPFVFDSSDTNTTFMKTYNLSVKLFHRDSQLANQEAERIADSIRSKRNVVPLLKADGTFTSDYVRINRIETRIADSGVATVSVTWNSRYNYERKDWPSIENIGFNNRLKEE